MYITVLGEKGTREFDINILKVTAIIFTEINVAMIQMYIPALGESRGERTIPSPHSNIYMPLDCN